MKRLKRKHMWFLLALPFLFVGMTNVLVELYAKGKTFNKSSDIEKNRVGLVLGTSKYSHGRLNRFFLYRIDAAVSLYKSGKIEYILVSGDNGSRYYDEPTDFQEELIKRGVPRNKIFLDYAGFRTLDSVVRAKKVFGQDKLTIISQQFHNERAIFLAKSHGIEAIGYNAKDVSGKNGLKVKLREAFARTKLFLDLIFQVEPRYLGEKITIG